MLLLKLDYYMVYQKIFVLEQKFDHRFYIQTYFFPSVVIFGKLDVVPSSVFSQLAKQKDKINAAKIFFMISLYLLLLIWLQNQETLESTVAVFIDTLF